MGQQLINESQDIQNSKPQPHMLTMETERWTEKKTPKKCFLRGKIQTKWYKKLEEEDQSKKNN